jgi:hypothetical protein
VAPACFLFSPCQILHLIHSVCSCYFDRDRLLFTGVMTRAKRHIFPSTIHHLSAGRWSVVCDIIYYVIPQQEDQFTMWRCPPNIGKLHVPGLADLPLCWLVVKMFTVCSTCLYQYMYLKQECVMSLLHRLIIISLHGVVTLLGFCRRYEVHYRLLGSFTCHGIDVQVQGTMVFSLIRQTLFVTTSFCMCPGRDRTRSLTLLGM